jgi:hypothetical protein
MDKHEHIAELVTVFDALKAAGWITGYSIVTDPWVVDWTDHGRQRAAELVAIHDELEPGGNMWVPLVAVCKFLFSGPPNVSPQSRN